MKKLIGVFLLSFYSGVIHAEDPLTPGSLYCSSVITLETQDYQNQKAKIDKIYAPIVAKMRSVLQWITPEQRAILQVEGSGSTHLESFWDKVTTDSKTYDNLIYPCPVDMEQWGPVCQKFNAKHTQAIKTIPIKKKGLYKSIDMNGGFDNVKQIKNRWVNIQHRDLSSDSEDYDVLQISPSTAEQEEIDIKNAVASKYLAPTLIDHLKKKINSKCFNEEVIAKINDDERAFGKVLPETGSKGKSSSKTGAGKQ